MDFEKYLEDILSNKITQSSCITCTWDAEGIWVDLNYEVSQEMGILDYQTVFAELYDSGNPNRIFWANAKRLAYYMGEKYSLPVMVGAERR